MLKADRWLDKTDEQTVKADHWTDKTEKKADKADEGTGDADYQCDNRKSTRDDCVRPMPKRFLRSNYHSMIKRHAILP